MRIYRYITMLILAVLAASCENPEVFYSTSYPIVRIDAEVTLTKPVTPPATPTADTGEGDEEEPAPEPEPEPEPEPKPEDPLVTEIRTDILSKAPMAAGGIYSIEFTHHNGGKLTTMLAPDTAPIEGVFVKTPGKGTLVFYFSEQMHTLSLSSYDDNGTRRIMLVADFTEHYKALYPERKDIEKAVRREYTSTPSK